MERMGMVIGLNAERMSVIWIDHRIMQTLRRHWPLAFKPRPIVIIRAGSIVSDAHLPAYRKTG